ncbi:MAG TPA: alternative ribosome rescue aminoacyl-tRNA hydrolase ArfB [Saprospiraceae bacterium]|nr:alternative ribosome rescue aminoacyl-tRNA hydrolase ArfB [Saprospiraceae bacterium]HNT21681.1 alternative ribosome rescue aminoacyl-tRNA hydrolase ArfB [Saprospiraceae bacterium]
MKINLTQLLSACRYETSRSSGPGGQHVNKTETKVTLYFNIGDSPALSEEQKAMLHAKYPNRINESGELYIHASASRSQSANKEAAILKLYTLVTEALLPRKKRVRTRPTSASKAQRLKVKKIKSEKKEGRRRKFD